jgi:CheY-like chemotaxis protein
VLVVDDEEDERELLTAILTLRGARVATAESAEDAVRALQAAAPDVLVSDMAMAGEDGCALLRRVRTEGGAARHVPAIAVTAHARHEDRERALAAGFRTYLPKPIDPRAAGPRRGGGKPASDPAKREAREARRGRDDSRSIGTAQHPDPRLAIIIPTPCGRNRNPSYS